MVYAGKDPVEALGDGMQIFKRQLALVELAVGKYPVHHLLREPLYPVRGRVRERLAGRLYGVGEHDEARLPGLGLWPGVSEVVLVHRP